MVDNAIWLLCAKSGLYLSNPELADMARGNGSAPEGGRAEALGALIRSWANRQDDGEQRETIDCLVDGLDRERLSARKLFPESWRAGVGEPHQSARQRSARLDHKSRGVTASGCLRAMGRDRGRLVVRSSE